MLRIDLLGEAKDEPRITALGDGGHLALDRLGGGRTREGKRECEQERRQ